MTAFDQVKKVGITAAQPRFEGCDEAFFRFNKSEYVMFPGFCDVHVHFREPGFSYKETILTGSASAAASGCTAVCTMPNLNPVPDCLEHLEPQLEKIAESPITILPYGSITIDESGKELSALEELAPYVAAFSDDGSGVEDDGLMREAMQRCRQLHKIIAGHCEDRKFDSPREREWHEVERNLKLAAETGCSFHVCHVSTKESVALIHDAKKSGLDVSCETAPHYLLLNRGLVDDDCRFRMNPPIGDLEDQGALLEALADGTIDMIATDHAPHSAEDKARGMNGVVGLETAFPVLYTALVLEGLISLEKLVQLMSLNPRSRFGIPNNGDYAIWDLDNDYVIRPEKFQSMGRFTPFDEWPVLGRCLMTAHNNQVIWEDKE